MQRPLTLALLGGALALSGWAVHRRARLREWLAAGEAAVTRTGRERTRERDVPDLARRIAARAGVPRAGHRAATVHLRQRGALCLRPGARPHRFEARQVTALRGTAFQTRTALVPGALAVVDRYVERTARLEARLLGAVVLHAHDGSAAARGAAQRYLAALPWTPDALLANPELQFVELDARVLEVACETPGGRARVRLVVDAADDVVACEADDLPFHGEPGVAPRPWRGELADHGELGGRRLPRRGVATWTLPGGPFVAWRGELTEAWFEDEPAA